MLPGESFVRAIVQTWNTNFGTTKILFDSSMTVIAGVLSFLFFGKLNGVREGTIIAALLVGFIARLFGKHLEFLKPYIFPEDYRTENSSTEDETTGEESRHKNVIVIGRQYGAGGHEIGKMLADRLGYDFYDQEIIKMAAGTTGMTSEFIEKSEETMTNSLLYDLVNQMYQYRDEKKEAPKDKIFDAESKVIKELADKGDCVIIGRCSDYVLRDDSHALKVFFHAPMESRSKRVMNRLGLEYNDAQRKIRKEDKYRADNYRYYTGRIWGAATNFDLTINTDLGADYIEKCIADALGR